MHDRTCLVRKIGHSELRHFKTTSSNKERAIVKSWFTSSLQICNNINIYLVSLVRLWTCLGCALCFVIRFHQHIEPVVHESS